MSIQDTPHLIRLTDAMKRYGLSRSTFDLATRRGEITKHNLARAAFLDTHEIDAWILGKSRPQIDAA